MTDLPLGPVRRGTTRDLTDYETHTPDGRPIRSSTMFVRDTASSSTVPSAAPGSRST